MPMPLRRAILSTGNSDSVSRRAGHGEACLQQIIRRRDAHLDLETAQEVAFAHGGDLRGIDDRNRPLAVVLQPARRSADLVAG